MRTNWIVRMKRALGMHGRGRRLLRRLSGPEALEGRAVPAVLTVNTTDDDNEIDTVLSLREAIEVVNGTLAYADLSTWEKDQVNTTEALGTNDRIEFELGDGIQTISVAVANGALPALTKKVTIEGATGPVEDTCGVRIDGNEFVTGSVPNVNGLTIKAKDCIISLIQVTRFTGAGILIDGRQQQNPGDVSGNAVINCVIGGNDPNDGTNWGNTGDGIYIDQSSSNWVGQATIGGVLSYGSNTIMNNAAAGVRIRGTAKTTAEANSNKVTGNYIASNGSAGVYLTGPAYQNVIETYIDGPGPNGRKGNPNYIVGNTGDGVHLGAIVAGSPDKNKIAGNYIGIEPDGSARGARVGNEGNGVYIQGSNENVVGGAANADEVAHLRNYISGNLKNGVEILSAAMNVVSGNYIGTSLDGQSSLDSNDALVGNNLEGVRVAKQGTGAAPTKNVVGGKIVAGNVISNNGKNGCAVKGSV